MKVAEYKNLLNIYYSYWKKQQGKTYARCLGKPICRSICSGVAPGLVLLANDEVLLRGGKLAIFENLMTGLNHENENHYIHKKHKYKFDNKCSKRHRPDRTPIKQLSHRLNTTNQIPRKKEKCVFLKK